MYRKLLASAYDDKSGRREITPPHLTSTYAAYRLQHVDVEQDEFSVTLKTPFSITSHKLLAIDVNGKCPDAKVET